MQRVVLPVMPPELGQLSGINSLILASRSALMMGFWPSPYCPAAGMGAPLVALRFPQGARNVPASGHSGGGEPRLPVRGAA
jgi:hypothetical protein